MKLGIKKIFVFLLFMLGNFSLGLGYLVAFFKYGIVLSDYLLIFFIILFAFLLITLAYYLDGNISKFERVEGEKNEKVYPADKK